MASEASRRWKENYKEVVVFGEIHGHIRIPSSVPKIGHLANWLRRQNKRTRLSSYERDKLDELWKRYGTCALLSRSEKEAEAWKMMYEELVSHYEMFGDHVVSIEEDPKLHKWILYQKQRAKQGKLPDERRKLLEQVDFVFECNAKHKDVTFTKSQVDQWGQNFAELAEYKKRFGDCRVPFRFPYKPSLGYWVAKQRRDFRDGRIDHERYKQLDELGFYWLGTCTRMNFTKSKASKTAPNVNLAT